MKTNRGAQFFQSDQVLILTGAAGCVMDEHDPEDAGKLYVVQLQGEDYDLRKANVRAEMYTRKVAIVMDGNEMVLIIRSLINMLVQAGEENLIVEHILAGIHRQDGKLN